ncbi:hypothetical protein AHAS_Ahas05G0157200 [Arachis hypogaea]
MTADAMNFIKKSEYARSKRVTIGNGIGLSISHVENYIFISDLNKKQFLLTKLLVVPQILKNLLSVYQFAKDNKVFFLKFHDEHCAVKCNVSKEVIL